MAEVLLLNLSCLSCMIVSVSTGISALGQYLAGLVRGPPCIVDTVAWGQARQCRREVSVGQCCTVDGVCSCTVAIVLSAQGSCECFSAPPRALQQGFEVCLWEFEGLQPGSERTFGVPLGFEPFPWKVCVPLPSCLQPSSTDSCDRPCIRATLLLQLACEGLSTACHRPLLCPTAGPSTYTRGLTLSVHDCNLDCSGEVGDVSFLDAAHPSFLVGFEYWLEAVGRSFLLLYFLSVFRVFAEAQCLRAGWGRRNAVIVRCRRGLRGAPRCLAFLFALSFVPVTQAVQNEHPCVDGNTAPAVRVEPSLPGSRFGELPVNGCGSCSSSHRPDFNFTINVIRFQRSAVQTSLSWDPGLSSGYVCASIRADLAAGLTDLVYFPAMPQPSIRQVVLGEAPLAALRDLRVPVFLQLAGTQEPCFLTFFTGAVSHSDIRIAVGDAWPAGGQVFVGFCQTPMEEDACVNPTRGLLFRIFPPRRFPPPVKSLDAKLADPYDLECLPLDAQPSPFPRVPKLAVLGRDDLAFAVDASTCITVGDLKDQVSHRIGMQPASLALFAPCVPIHNLLLCGDAVASVLGVFPTRLAECCGVFVDARDIGHPLTLVALPPHPFTLTALRGLLRISRPQNLAHSFHGMDALAGNEEGFLPQHSAVVRLLRTDIPALSPDEFLAIPSSVEEDLDTAAGPGDVEPAGSLCARGVHSAPDSNASLGVVPLASAALVPFVSDEDAPISSMWNRGFSQHAPSPCRLGDTPVDLDSSQASVLSTSSDVVVAPSAVLPPTVGDPIGGHHLREPVLRRSPTCEDEAIRLDVADAPDSADCSSAQYDDSPRSSPPFDEWRLPVRILHFQREATVDIQWVAAGETPAEVLLRAEILFTPEGDLFELSVPDCQPTADCLTFLCYPRWWKDVGAVAFIVANAQAADMPYMQVRWPTDEMCDLLLLTGQPHPFPISTFVAGASTGTAPQPLPEQNGLLLIQRAGLPAPAFASAQDIVNDATLDTREADLERLPPAPDTCSWGSGLNRVSLRSDRGLCCHNCKSSLVCRTRISYTGFRGRSFSNRPFLVSL